MFEIALWSTLWSAMLLVTLAGLVKLIEVSREERRASWLTLEDRLEEILAFVIVCVALGVEVSLLTAPWWSATIWP